MSIVKATDAFAAHLDALRRAPTAPQGLPTGIPDLDRLLGGGLNDGEVTTVFARTSIGKSSLLLDMIQGFCEHLLQTKDARTVAFVSAEMPGKAIVQRLCAMNLGIPRDKLRVADPKTINEFLAYLKTWPLTILEERAPELERVTDWLHIESGGFQGKGRPPFAAIVVDHLGKIQTAGVYDIYPKTSKLAEAFFTLAGFYSCPLVQAAQVNRGVEGRISRNQKTGEIDVSMTRPLPSDVEGSGKVEQNSDVMLALWREEHYMAIHEQRRENPGPLEVNVCKNRSGPTGFVRGEFDPELTKISWVGKVRGKPTKASAMAGVRAVLAQAAS